MPSSETLAIPMFKWIGNRRFVHGNDGRELIFFHGGIGLRVQNYSSGKKIIIRFSIYREDGAAEQYILFPSFKKHLENGDEEWATHQLPIFPWHSPHGNIKAATFSYILQAENEALYPECEFLFAHEGDFANGSLNHDFPIVSYSDFRPFRFERTSLEEAAWSIYNSPLYHKVLFTREPTYSHYHPLKEIHTLLDKVEENLRNEPYRPHYVHFSLFNFDNINIARHLIHLSHIGVNVECIGGWEQLSSCDWSESVAELRRNNIPVIGVVRSTPFEPSDGIASMHTKFIVFDGMAVMSSSYNLDFDKWTENRENGIFYYSPAIALLYEHIFQTIKGAPFQTYTVEPSAQYNLYYSLGSYMNRHGLHFSGCDIIEAEIYGARETILAVMFDVGDFHMPGSGRTLFQALIDSARRGVAVRLVLNGFKSEVQHECPWEAGNRPLRQDLNILAENGITVNLLYNNHNHYSPLHHKFVIIDGENVMAESANWYPATLYSDEVFSVIRNRETAAEYIEELLLLLKYYRVKTF